MSRKHKNLICGLGAAVTILWIVSLFAVAFFDYAWWKPTDIHDIVRPVLIIIFHILGIALGIAVIESNRPSVEESKDVSVKRVRKSNQKKEKENES